MSTIAERLLLLRGKARQGAFAKALGINPNTLRSYENGRTSPNQEFLEQICVQFSVSPEWLLLGRGAMESNEGDGKSESASSQAADAVCARCAKLEKRLEAAEEERRRTSEKLVETLQANAALITELGEQKLENVKLLQQVETARQRCKEYAVALKEAGGADPSF